MGDPDWDELPPPRGGNVSEVIYSKVVHLADLNSYRATTTTCSCDIRCTMYDATLYSISVTGRLYSLSTSSVDPDRTVPHPTNRQWVSIRLDKAIFSPISVHAG